MENNSTQPINSQPAPQPAPAQPPIPPVNPVQPAAPKSSSPIKKILIIIGAIVAGIIVLAVLIIVIVSATSKHMKCTSSVGDIDIMYNDTQVTGYAGNGISYDLDYQQAYSKQVGIENYLNEFEGWFQENTSGTCSR